MSGDNRDERKSDFEKKLEEIKAKAAIGLFGARIFLKEIVLPKAQELSTRIRDKAEEILERLSADNAGASFEESLRTKREVLLKEGLTAKEADEAIERLVKRTLKGSGSKKAKGGKDNE